jgi:23S rRNA pseudouridine2605 synthase
MEVRLQKAIAEAGICSRRKAEELIQHGHVRVNGEIAEIGMNVDIAKDKIMVDGQYLRPEKKVYLMLNKPKGYLTTASDPFNRKHILHLIDEPVRVFPIGRLDRDTTGLLLLTNDGDFANKIMHPRYNVQKTYEATLDRRIETEDLETINNGVMIDGVVVHAFAQRIGPKAVKIVVHTGMNKEVKRIFKKVGYWVETLRRTEIKGVKLTPKEGRYRPLTAAELAKLMADDKKVHGKK